MLPHPHAEHTVHFRDCRSACEDATASVGLCRYQLYGDEPTIAGEPACGFLSRIESEFVPSQRPCFGDCEPSLGGIARSRLSTKFPCCPSNGVECGNPLRGVGHRPRSEGQKQAAIARIDTELLLNVGYVGRPECGQAYDLTGQAGASTTSPESLGIDAHAFRVAIGLRVPSPSNCDE